eukprot:1161904-Pelagomonas_calceolata.AAC.15
MPTNTLGAREEHEYVKSTWRSMTRRGLGPPKQATTPAGLGQCPQPQEQLSMPYVRHFRSGSLITHLTQSTFPSES